MSGIFLFLAYAPFWQSWALWVYLFFLYRHEKQRRTLWQPLITWLIFHVIQYHWLIYPLQEKAGLNWPLSAFFVLVASSIHTSVLISLLWVRRQSTWGERFPVTSWVVIGLGFEWLKASLLGGFPWVTVAISQMSFGFSSMLPLLGQMGTCAFVFAFTGLLVERFRNALWLLLIVLVMSVYPFTQHSVHNQLIRVYQISNEDPPAHFRYVLDLMEQAQALNGSVIIFPEGTISTNMEWLGAIRQHIMSSDSALLLGVNLQRDDGTVTNSAASANDQYDKKKLVPFGEVLPFGLGWMNQSIFSFPYVVGSQSHPVKLMNQLYNIMICYDIFFPDRYLLFGQLPMILLIDDHWYQDSWVREYHFRQAKMVSQILGQNLISSSADGVTGFIEQDQVDILDIKAQGFITRYLKVHEHHGLLFIPWIEWLFSWLAIIGIVIYSLDAIFGKKRVKRKHL
ncbi:hypothetical protein N9C31_02800 [Gammaproteobacteria bacterium]|nr:hypothetical protein [Gammaproteobacteria bacterium]